MESSPSRQRRPPCKTNKGISDEAADAAAFTYLLTYLGVAIPWGSSMGSYPGPLPSFNDGSHPCTLGSSMGSPSPPPFPDR